MDRVVFGPAFDNYLRSEDFESSVIESTKASQVGEFYAVELFRDGRYRLLHSDDMVNPYHPHGMILRIPALAAEAYNEEDAYESDFENVGELIMDMFWEEQGE